MAENPQGRTVSEGSWLDSLPARRLFSHLREKGSGVEAGGNMMCMIKENLFIWSQEELALLTVNLKRLCASPTEDIFQTLLCTLPDLPDGDDLLLNLIPEESGRYVLLHCRRGVAVVKLHYHRGEYGEFSGGGKSVLCRTVQIAGDIFTINDRLVLVQASWYPPTPDTLALLTSDNFIRLYHLAEPNLPVLELPLFSPSTIHFYPSTIKLEEYCIAAFATWNDSAFIFHDSGDLSLVSLSPHAKPRPLSMHPQDTKGNYICSSCSILLLDTTPLAVILAGKSEMDDMMVCHCLYLEDLDGDGQETEEGASRDSERLYVVESIHIQSSESDRVEGDLMLLHDPATPHSYFVRHPAGVHTVHMPWLRKLERFTGNDMSTLVSHGECQVNYLLGTVPNFTSLQGVSVLWEPRLGYALIGLTSGDLECLTLTLDERRWECEGGDLRGDHVDWPAQRNTILASPAPWRSSAFVKTIQDVLHPSTEEFSLPLRSHKRGGKDSGSESQADCLQFLMQSVKQLRLTYIMRQQQALKETERRVAMSKRLKEQIISDLAKLRESRDIIQEESEELQHKMSGLLTRNKNFLQRVKRLACRVESRSPLISEAEECMMKEVEGVRDHIKTMAMETLTDKGKLRLCNDMDAAPHVDINASQCSSLLKKLTHNGEKIKTLAAMVKNLGEVLPT